MNPCRNDEFTLVSSLQIGNPEDCSCVALPPAFMQSQFRDTGSWSFPSLSLGTSVNFVPSWFYALWPVDSCIVDNTHLKPHHQSTLSADYFNP